MIETPFFKKGEGDWNIPYECTSESVSAVETYQAMKIESDKKIDDMSSIERAQEIITLGRDIYAGEPERNQEKIGDIWTTLLKDKLKPDVEITGADVCLMMIGLKLVREVGKHKQDNIDDILGYGILLDKVTK